MLTQLRNYLLLVILSVKVIYSSGIYCNQTDYIKCATEDRCVLRKFVCDEDDDCADKSDEVNCDYSKPCVSATEHKCGNGRCILNKWKCDGYPDCIDGSDERMCNKTCAPAEFSCNNGICLSKKFICDRQKDCLGGEDEKDCVYSATCSPGQFQCNNTRCIDKIFLCDSDDDCDDNSDEENCGKTCKPGSFSCKSGSCISGNLRCNGKADCSDGSDEDQCPTVSKTTCFVDEFTCSSGECVSGTFRCDGENDCPDKSDEFSCGTITCPANSDICDNKKCIMKYKFCNGNDDCGDNSDEKDSRCLKTTPVTPTKITCKATEYKCNNATKCIDSNKVCDQKQDCPDNDDESSCFVNECQNNNGNCSQLCVDTNTSFYCSCKHGYSLNNDSKTCQDIDECKVFGTCSQTCINIIGRYKCSCLPGYRLAPDGKRCMVSGQLPNLLAATGMDIREFSIRGSSLSRVVGNNTKMVVAVGLYYKEKKIFWSDMFMKKILSDSIGMRGNDPKVLAESRAKSFSIDWVTGKIYWISTSPTGTRIEVAELDGSHHKVLINTSDTEAHSIVVDPVRGYLYWTNPSIPSISRAYMDGKNTEDIVTDGLISPTGLTIDFTTKNLFWLDSKRHSVESSDLDGSKHRDIVTRDINHPCGIAVFEDTVYWSETMSKRVLSANKFTGNDRVVLSGHENISSYEPRGLLIDHPMTQPNAINRCKNNGGCSHLCLLTPRGHSCACPDTTTLLPDRKTCKIVREEVSSPAPSATSTKLSSSKGNPKTTDNIHPGDVRGNKSDKGFSASVIGGIVGGILLLLIVVIIFYILCRRKKNSRKMEIQYSSELGVKIVSSESKNPVQGKKDVNREEYLKFANQNFKEDIEDEEDDDDDDDINNADEKQPVFKPQRNNEVGGQIV